MVMWLVIGGSSFAALLGMTGVRHLVSETLLGLIVAPFIIIVLMQLVGLFLGMFIDQASIIIICIPIFMPIVRELGFDPLWFCLLFSVNMIVGLLTPPFGANLFYTKGIVPPDVSMADIYRSVIPYVLLMLVVLLVGLFWPPLLTWLPNTMIR